MKIFDETRKVKVEETAKNLDLGDIFYFDNDRYSSNNLFMKIAIDEEIGYLNLKGSYASIYDFKDDAENLRVVKLHSELIVKEMI